MASPSQSVSPSDAGPGVLIERSGEVLTFTLNNPTHGNEVTGAMLYAMLTELRSEASAPRARVLRIRARGKVFCTGRERGGPDAEFIRNEAARLIAFKHALRMSPLISVAEVQGDAYGFGFALAILCDFVLAAENVSLAFPEMRYGLAPSAIMAFLGEYALPRFAFPLVLFGDSIGPHRALQIGLISQVCPADQLAGEANALVGHILRLDPAAARQCKEFFLSTQQNSFDHNCERAVEVLTEGSLALFGRQK